MKQHVLTIAAILGIGLLTAFTINHEVKKSAAEVKQMQGLYIFFCAEPVKETEYLGNVKATMYMSTDTDDRINSVIKKCKKDYPQAEAIVFKSLDLTTADAVKFK